MLRVIGPEHLLALKLLIDRVLLVHFHDSHEHIILCVPQGHFFALADGFRQGLVRRERDRDWPEQTVLAGQLVVVAATFPVVLAHESIKRSESADPHHDQIAGFAAGQGNLLQPLSSPGLFAVGFAFQQEWLQFRTAVRWKEFAHRSGIRESSRIDSESTKYICSAQCIPSKRCTSCDASTRLSFGVSQSMILKRDATILYSRL